MAESAAPSSSVADDAAKDESLDALFTRLDSSPRGLSEAEAEKRLAHYGYNAIAEKRANPLLKFFGYFWGPIAWMIEVAAVLSAIVHHWADLTIIMVLLIFNGAIGFWEEYQAGNAIDQLRKNLALTARVLRDGKWREIEAPRLVPGDVVRLRLGDVVPADVRLFDGEYLSVDQSALTGESLPVDKKPGDVAYSGSIAKQGEMAGVVTVTGMDTFFGRTARLVSTAHNVSHFQRAVLTIGDYLIYLSLALVAVLIVVELDRGEPWLTVVQFALILTVASIPVAMPAVLSVTMAIGAMALSKMKAIVARLESIEEMAGMDILCSDKTGTLTENRLTLGDPIVFGEGDIQSLILNAVLASKEENRDAIDLAIAKGLKSRDALAGFRQKSFVPFDPVRKRTEATVENSSGGVFHVSKGAPQVILEMSRHDPALASQVDQKVNEFAVRGDRTLGVARSDDGTSWTFLGLLPLSDPPREDAAQTIADAGEHGIEVKMVTGDNLAIAREISSQLKLGTNIALADKLLGIDGGKPDLSEVATQIEKADGFAQVFPEHKYQIVKALQLKGHLVGMTGDGVNDAPALKQADVGIAVSGATDAARAAADLVLTEPGLSVIVRAVEEARRIFERMNSYAIYRITETIRIMIFIVLAILVYRFYPITTIMIILLALLNDLPIMTIAYDNTWLDPQPVRWRMYRVLRVATVLGAVGVAETFLLLVIAKSYFGVGLAQLQSLIFIKLVVAGHLTLFVARTRRPFFTRPFPSLILLCAILTTQITAAVIVGLGLFVAPIPWLWIGYVWAYCIAWIFIEDIAKLLVYRHLDLSSRRHQRFLSLAKQGMFAHGTTPSASKGAAAT
ncbi:MAG TPA: plasma-membrane proton-efflux P-type ATPase [Candidatus Binataceae bacterium]|nr:plasma-membrane proton-efflux P-type ATPase [Candidatus Binataceae bacterium]